MMVWYGMPSKALDLSCTMYTYGNAAMVAEVRQTVRNGY